VGPGWLVASTLPRNTGCVLTYSGCIKLGKMGRMRCKVSFHKQEKAVANGEPAANHVEIHFKLEGVYQMCRRRRRVCQRRLGAAAVEFAIVAPIFFLMILGMLELGRAVMVQQVITNASREGARIAVLDGSLATGTDDEPGVTDSIANYLTSANIDPDSVTITIDPATPSSASYGAPVTVTISVPFSEVSWLPTPKYLGNKTLSSATVMRRETVQ
jgi:Flp pilus assembly protein TadG